MKVNLKLISLLLISWQLVAQTPEKLTVTLNREEVKKLRELMRSKYRDTVLVGKEKVLDKSIEDVINSNKPNAAIADVSVKDLLKIAESYLDDFIAVETRKKGRNSFVRIMRQIRQQDPNLRSMLEQDGYLYRSREYVPLILDILDKEK